MPVGKLLVRLFGRLGLEKIGERPVRVFPRNHNIRTYVFSNQNVSYTARKHLSK